MREITNLLIEDKVYDILPELKIYTLTANNINNKMYDQEKFKNLLAEASFEAKGYVSEDALTNNKVIREWRDTFQKFKTKKGARPSIDALLKHVKQGREFTPINTLVDIYNSVSLKYGVPCGGEDIDKIKGEFKLKTAKGGEEFFPLGAENNTQALEDELIYADDIVSICRSLNWREAQRTMLTEETINEAQSLRAKKAINELKQLIDKHYDIESEIKVFRYGRYI